MTAVQERLTALTASATLFTDCARANAADDGLLVP